MKKMKKKAKNKTVALSVFLFEFCRLLNAWSATHHRTVGVIGLYTLTGVGIRGRQNQPIGIIFWIREFSLLIEYVDHFIKSHACFVRSGKQAISTLNNEIKTTKKVTKKVSLRQNCSNYGSSSTENLSCKFLFFRSCLHSK